MTSQYSTGRVAIVTGAGQGIGASIAHRLSVAGITVAIADINSEAARKTIDSIAASGGTAVAYECDVSRSDSVKAVFDSIIQRHGKIDILVNNAGVGGNQIPLEEQPDEEWHRVIGVDLTGVFYCCRAVIPHMRKQKYGRIINISSSAGKDGSPNLGPYSAAKAGVIGLTKSLAKEVAQYNILVNVVTPSLTETPLLSEMAPERIQTLLACTPIRRLCRSEEIAAMVYWLASDEVSYSTGAVFDITGGRATY